VPLLLLLSSLTNSSPSESEDDDDDDDDDDDEAIDSSSSSVDPLFFNALLLFCLLGCPFLANGFTAQEVSSSRLSFARVDLVDLVLVVDVFTLLVELLRGGILVGGSGAIYKTKQAKKMEVSKI
jgi:hypothetical protein